jgi:hypothetical protein
MFVIYKVLESFASFSATKGMVIASSAALGILVFALWPSGVTMENFKRIENGMTQKEVEYVFGAPGMEYPVAGVRTLAWCAGDGALATVRFDRNGRVERAYWFSPTETFFQRWRNMVQRQLSIP